MSARNEEYDYEAVPAAEARRIVRTERWRAYGAHWATIAGMMLAGACVIALVANLAALPPSVAVLAPTAVLSFLGGWWMRGRRRRTVGVRVVKR